MDSTEHIRETVFLFGDFPLKISFWEGKDFEDQMPAYHSELELQMVLQGTCRYFVHDARYLLEKNSVLLIHKDEVHNYVREEGVFIRVWTLTFSPSLLKGRKAAVDVLRSLDSVSHVVLTAGQTASLSLVLRDISEECQHQSGYWQEMVVSHLERLLIQLHRAASDPERPDGQVNPFLQGIIEYLEEHFAESLTLVEVAERFGVSPSHLSRVFKLHAGLGFKDYLIHLRIIESRRLLEETDRKISTVAHDVGFEDISNFHHTFRSLIGVSPGAYRRVRNRIPAVQETMRE